ncbi:histidine kinase [Ignatzschineria sp. LJL83]
MLLHQFWQKLIRKPHKLSTLLTSCILLWLFGAIFLIGLSLNVSWRLEERGVTINEIGSLRKQSFYLHNLSQIDDIQKQQIEYEKFISILDKISLFSAKDFNNKSQYQVYLAQLTQIKTVAKEILPHFNPAIKTNNQLPFYEVEYFVEEISKLVDIIEDDNTRSILFLRWFQGLLLLMAITSAIFSYFFLRKLVISPLNQLNIGINDVKQGKFNQSIEITVNNELGDIIAGFNEMSRDLAYMYQGLEKLVDEKTEELQKKNQDLTFLYKIASLLQNNHTIDLLAEQFLETIISYSYADAGTIRVLNASKNSSDLVTSLGFNKTEMTPQHLSHCSHLTECYCGISLTQPQNVFQKNIQDLNTAQFCQENHFQHLVSLKLAANEESFGSVNLFFSRKEKFKQDDIHILENATRQLGLILENRRFDQLEKQMAVLEERNLMAQGLHDSIAQSLSFLNMQSQLLTKAISNNNLEMRDRALSFIKEGIQESYDDIRELLLNFRVNMNPENFADTIVTLIERFKHQTDITVHYDFLEFGRDFSPETQLQIIFIMQEALSNIRKHAEATQVNITIEQQQAKFILLIKDNGIGFDETILNQKQENGHVGTLIMKERALKANGTLTITSQPHEGTSVLLEIHRTHII